MKIWKYTIMKIRKYNNIDVEKYKCEKCKRMCKEIKYIYIWKTIKQHLIETLSKKTKQINKTNKNI